MVTIFNEELQQKSNYQGRKNGRIRLYKQNLRISDSKENHILNEENKMLAAKRVANNWI